VEAYADRPILSSMICFSITLTVKQHKEDPWNVHLMEFFVSEMRIAALVPPHSVDARTAVARYDSALRRERDFRLAVLPNARLAKSVLKTASAPPIFAIIFLAH
jgi:hypothetical protein